MWQSRHRIWVKVVLPHQKGDLVPAKGQGALKVKSKVYWGQSLQCQFQYLGRGEANPSEM